MEYLVIFLLLIYGSIKYDLHLLLYKKCSCYNTGYDSEQKLPSKEKVLYNILFILLFLLSGLSYRIGTDVGNYMNEFKYTSWSYLDFSDISLSARQPFWVLLENVCKEIYDDFALFKIIISGIVCYTIFYFYRTNTKYIFTALFFYYIYLSFDINFNILRQSLSISSFIGSYIFYSKKKYILTCLCLISSILFHNSAVFLLVVPLLMLVKMRKHFYMNFLILIILCVLVITFQINIKMFSFLWDSSDGDFGRLSYMYLNSDEYGSADYSVISIIFYMLLFIFITINYYKSGASQLNLLLLFLYIFIFFGSAKVPILGRIKHYFTPFYILAICNGVGFFIKNIKTKSIALKQGLIFLIFIIISYIPIRYFFVVNPRIDKLNIYQYYPYYSIIDPKKSIDRERNMLE